MFNTLGPAVAASDTPVQAGSRSPTPRPLSQIHVRTLFRTPRNHRDQKMINGIDLGITNRVNDVASYDYGAY